MSNCPPSILRTTIRTGLSSCVPHHRICPGHWYQQRAKALTARYMVNDASDSDVTGSNDTHFVNHEVRPSRPSQNDTIKNLSQNADNSGPELPIPCPESNQGEDSIQFRGTGRSRRRRTDNDIERSNAGTGQNSFQPAYTRRRVGSPRPERTARTLSRDQVRAIARRKGLNVGVVNSVVSRFNKRLQHQRRVLKPQSVQQDVIIRLTSLYSRMLGHRQWRAAYSEIHKAKRGGHEVKNEAVIPKLNKNGLALLELVKEDCQGKFAEAWEALPRTGKAMHWQRLALWLLRNSPDLTLEFLLVTTKNSDKPNFSMVADCMAYLDEFHYNVLGTWQKGSYTYQSLVETCLDPNHWPILSLPQKGVRIYLLRASYDAVCSAFKMVCERRIEMTAQTVLCFMLRFTEFGDVDRALDALRYIPKLRQAGFSLFSQGVMRHCCKLLTLDSVQESNGARNFRILPQLLEMGVRPNRDMMNVVLANAFKTGDPQLGLDMLEFMKSQGHELDSYTYVTLLGDAVAREDRTRFGELMHEVEQKYNWKIHRYLASKVFHAHYVFTAKHMESDANPIEVFYSMLKIYNELHDITPLKDLLIIPPNYQPPPGSGTSSPSLMALYIMIATYFRCQRRISIVHQVYTRFRTLVMEGHEVIAPLAETDHTYNEFLIAYRNDPRALRYCLQLVEDMLQRPLPVEFDAGRKRKIITHAKPTPRTWTILLSAFTWNRQTLAAEKVKELMAKQKVEFNQVTWNVIVNSFANAQDVAGTARSIKLMEENGFSIDAYTMKSFRYLRDPERLWIALDELDQKADAEAGLQSTVAPQNETSKARELLLDQGLRRLEAKARLKQ
ncbi:hypothetical protein MAP00_000626 [Monascus purpureus]|nr:hypothetical protein MAP00_000626 [Monascus purpureus]